MSTNFFQRQERARRNTTRLVMLFILALIALVSLSYFPVLLLYHVATDCNKTTAKYVAKPIEYRLWEPSVLIATAVGTLTIVGLGSAHKVSQLSGGGKSVALLLGGKQIPTNTRDHRLRRVLNVVEEMSIASGVPVPPVFLLSDEAGINAFAAGYAPEDAVIAVSQGCLDYLNRDELQGVVAHEFSHILNGDMRLNIRLVGLIHGLIVLSLIGHFLMRLLSEGTKRQTRNTNKGKGGKILVAVFLLGLALYILGSVGAFFGWLMQAAVSRQREFLADASAVQSTRNPDGIAGALKKIGGLYQSSQIENVNASQVNHMFFANAFKSRLSALFATHPPLEVRFKAIDPNWDGVYPNVRRVSVEVEPAQSKEITSKQIEIPGIPQVPLPILTPQLAVNAAIERMGNIPDDSWETAAAFELEITPEIRDVIGEPFSARAIILALLLDGMSEVRERQLLIIRAVSDPRHVDEMLRYEDHVRAIPVGTRLAVTHFAMPALRSMSRQQYLAFRFVMNGMIRADGRISLFEYCLQHMLTKHLDRAFALQGHRPWRYTGARSIREQVVCFLGLLAWTGNRTPEATSDAFFAGMKEWETRHTAVLPKQASCSLERFTVALGFLEQATPHLKQKLVRAAVVTITTYCKVTGLEYGILRTVCASLDCPFPPVGRQETGGC